MADNSLVLIGAGNMGGAIANGWLSAGLSEPPIIVEPRPNARVLEWADAGAVELNPEPAPARILMIGIKPQMFHQLAGELRAWVGPDTLVISIMAGITIEVLAAKLGAARVIRVMPNTPGGIGRGVALVAPGAGCSDSDMVSARQLLTPLGHVEGPMSEDMLSVATGLSGCGPAYVFLLAEVLADAAIAQGVPADMAQRLAQFTVSGSAELLAQSDQSAGQLREAVTSPNGVTQAALQVLMADGAMPSLFQQALAAATARDRALSAPQTGET